MLFRAEKKINQGWGVDTSPSMIQFADKKKRTLGLGHIEFIQEDICSCSDLPNYEVDVASSTLCMHEMTEPDAIDTLKLLARRSSRIIVADYYKPSSAWSKLAIEVDEFISGHYGRFREYRRNGYIPELAFKAGLKVTNERNTSIDGISIWELK